MWIDSHKFLEPQGRDDALTVKAYVTTFWPNASRIEAVPAACQLESTKQLHVQSVLPKEGTGISANALDINMH